MRTQVNTKKNTQKIPFRISPSKWAHLTEKTDEQSPSTDIHKMEAHLVVSRMRGGARGSTRGSAKPRDRPNLDWHQSRCASAGDSPLSSSRRLSTFPYLEMAGTDLSSYRRASSHPSQIINTYTFKKKSSSRTSTCIIRVGSVRGGGSEKSRTCRPLFVLYFDRYKHLSKYPEFVFW